PFVLLLVDYWPLRRWKKDNARDLLVEKLPFFLLTGIVSVVTYFVQKQAGMMKEMAGLSLSLRVENALVSYVRYAGKLFWPTDLCALYPHPGHWSWEATSGAALLVCGISIFVGVIRKHQPWLLTGWFWYLGTLVPMIGLVQVGVQSMADRYSYIPTIGLLIALIYGVS